MIRLKYTFFLLSCGALLCGCSNDNLPGDNTGNISTQPLTITVRDGGFHGSGDIQTRYEEIDYQTIFTAGDKIGLFAVENGELIDNIQNLCLTAVNNGRDGIYWEMEGGRIPLSDNFSYFAYYPYLADVSNFEFYTGSDDADNFFWEFLDGWDLFTDQSTLDKYTSQDLMIAKGSIIDNKLSFVMKHKMKLLVIDLPVSDNVMEASDVCFFNFSPYRMGDGTYHYLMHPYDDYNDLSVFVGSYTNADNVSVRWRIEPEINEEGYYRIYTIDGGSAN
ncbi:MAG: fimbrillin family protein [Parabacteroides sp.]|nr:fimbrillin family protein [Parabacteroides sp.]